MNAATEPADRLTVAWAGDTPRIRAFLDAHGCRYDLRETGRGAAWKLLIHQVTPKLGGNNVTARVGDTLHFEHASLCVEKRETQPKPVVGHAQPTLLDALAESEATS